MGIEGLTLTGEQLEIVVNRAGDPLDEVADFSGAHKLTVATGADASMDRKPMATSARCCAPRAT
ncbi:hypothetical protein HK414_16160 [Ramlibacter terrae]|uniref:Uncharacterized protein n=1 Tax=Ramlibacter terrae TaxID=2732511 RepID=A0ABX6P5A5_9BURK|nr:hypothetical protein HK414_16160 [Ramlibacter terrae]